MAKLDRPLFGDDATGTFARALSFRSTTDWNIVSKIPVNSCPPSPAQLLQRTRYNSALSAWRALDVAERAAYNLNKPENLSGFNFFIRLFLLQTLYYLGYCIFYQCTFQLSTSPDQPLAADYDIMFPACPDEFPILANGAHSPQAWLLNRAYDSMISIQDYLINHKQTIEGR